MRECAGAVLVRDGCVLLGRRAANRQFYPDCWDVLGGHLEEGETPVAALTRELQEEAGITPIEFTKLGTLGEPHPEIHGPGLYHIYAVTAWSGSEPKRLGAEHSELRWFLLDEAYALPDLALAEYRSLFTTLRGTFRR